MDAMKLIDQIIADKPLLTEWRRDFHAHPELAYEEHRTASLVAERLATFGIEVELTPAEAALHYTRANTTDGLRQLLEEKPGLLDQLRREHPGLCKNVAAEHTAMLDLLIELGFDVNDRSDTKTALHHAAEANDTNQAGLLVAPEAAWNIILCTHRPDREAIG